VPSCERGSRRMAASPRRGAAPCRLPSIARHPARVSRTFPETRSESRPPSRSGKGERGLPQPEGTCTGTAGGLAWTGRAAATKGVAEGFSGHRSDIGIPLRVSTARGLVDRGYGGRSCRCVAAEPKGAARCEDRDRAAPACGSERVRQGAAPRSTPGCGKRKEKAPPAKGACGVLPERAFVARVNLRSLAEQPFARAWRAPEGGTGRVTVDGASTVTGRAGQEHRRRRRPQRRRGRSSVSPCSFAALMARRSRLRAVQGQATTPTATAVGGQGSPSRWPSPCDGRGLEPRARSNSVGASARVQPAIGCYDPRSSRVGLHADEDEEYGCGFPVSRGRRRRSSLPVHHRALRYCRDHRRTAHGLDRWSGRS